MRINLNLALTSFIVGLFGFLAKDVRADGYENVPTGSRTAAMGGTGIAAGWDSAMPILNPAGLALIPNSVASLSASLYQTSAISIDNYVADGDTIPHPAGDLKVSRPGVESFEFGSFPSGLSYFLHAGTKNVPMTFAASLSVPRHLSRRFVLNTEFNGEGRALGVSVSDNITTIVFEEQYMAAISWAMALGSLRVGLSALGSYTSFARTSDRSQFIAVGTANFRRELVKEATFIESIDAGVVAGIQYEIMDWLGVGFSARLPSVHITGALDRSVDLTEIRSGDEPLIVSDQFTGDPETTRGFPAKFGAGLVMRGDSWSLALDAQFFRPGKTLYQIVGDKTRSQVGLGNSPENRSERIAHIEVAQSVLNFAVGVEYALTEVNWLRAGFFTEYSASLPAEEAIAMLPGASPEFLFTFPIDRYGVSVGLGTKLGPIDTTVGFRTTFGVGGTPRYAPDKAFFDHQERYLDTTPAKLVDTVVFISAAIDVMAETEKLEKQQQEYFETQGTQL